MSDTESNSSIVINDNLLWTEEELYKEIEKNEQIDYETYKENAYKKNDSFYAYNIWSKNYMIWKDIVKCETFKEYLNQFGECYYGVFDDEEEFIYDLIGYYDEDDLSGEAYNYVMDDLVKDFVDLSVKVEIDLDQTLKNYKKKNYVMDDRDVYFVKSKRSRT